jgi:hypothetical protein
VDRAALDVAIALGIPHGGWCPRGRVAEDGRIPLGYRLRETESSEYPVRTERNVIDSSGTLIVCRGPLLGGTALTRRFATQHGRPLLVVDLAQADANRPDLATWLIQERIRVLNVAGPRESSSPGIGDATRAYLGDRLKPFTTVRESF